MKSPYLAVRVSDSENEVLRISYTHFKKEYIVAGKLGSLFWTGSSDLLASYIIKRLDRNDVTPEYILTNGYFLPEEILMHDSHEATQQIQLYLQYMACIEDPIPGK